MQSFDERVNFHDGIIIFARFLDTLAAKQTQKIKLPPPCFKIYTFFSSGQTFWWPKSHVLIQMFIRKRQTSLICISWRSCEPFLSHCPEEPVNPSFLIVLCNVDFKISILGNVILNFEVGLKLTSRTIIQA